MIRLEIYRMFSSRPISLSGQQKPPLERTARLFGDNFPGHCPALDRYSTRWFGIFIPYGAVFGDIRPGHCPRWTHIQRDLKLDASPARSEFPARSEAGRISCAI